MTRGRYPWRTAVRAHAPWRPTDLGALGEGRRDCGDHDASDADHEAERCRHCQVGERPYDPAHVPACDDDGPRRAR